MNPIFAFTFGGGVLAVLATFAQQHRRPTLLDMIGTTAPDSQKQNPLADIPKPLSSIRACVERWDGHYQSLIQTRLDPFLMGRLRSQQMLELAGSKQRILGRQEKRVNRSLLWGFGGLGLIALKRLTGWPLVPVILALGCYIIWPALREAWRVTAEERRFSLLHLFFIYFAWLWFGGNYLAGTFGIIFGGLCMKVELLTQTVTRHSLTHLFGEQPAQVWVLLDGVEIEMPFEQLQLGDILVLTAGQQVPVDGVVVQGNATMDQHHLTGESQPVEKAVGDTVLAATLMLGGRIHVRVEKTGAETTAAKIGDVLNHTVERPEVQLADVYKTFEYTRWPMLAGSALGWLIGGPSKAVAILGCNYLTSQIPLRLLTLLNGLGFGAEHGILVKDGRALERLPRIDTVVFDKTGTLTLDRQQVVQIHACANYAEAEVLWFAATAEQRQTHPIAQAILAAAAERQMVLPPLSEAHYELGFGLTTWMQGQRVRIGSERFLAMENLSLSASLRQVQHAAHALGQALVFVAVGEELAGAVELAATLRPESQATIEFLRKQGLALYIISGDQEAPTLKLSAELGMSGYFANTLPEQKAERIKELQAQGKQVCFIGDGINDAIALRQAEVSISLRGATTVATDAAQVVLMEDDLAQLRTLWELALGFERSLADNARQAKQLSLLAAAGVLVLPFNFWVSELLWGVQIISGVRTAQRPLLSDRGKPKSTRFLKPSRSVVVPG